MSRIEEAKAYLAEEGTTFVAIRQDGSIYRSEKKGIAPVMELLAQDPEQLVGATVADKVIGRAAALLLMRAGIAVLHARLISTHAREALKGGDIILTYETEVAYIINRTRTGMCPMEESVLDVTDVEQAYAMLKAKAAQLQKK